MTQPVTLVRRERFCASHRLYNPAYDDEWNKRIFGLCSNVNGHGHNYYLEVHVKGGVDPHTGMVMNMMELNQILQKAILVYVDHHNLNTDVPFLKGIIPTMENMANAFWKELDPYFPDQSLQKIVLSEIEESWVEITRS